VCCLQIQTLCRCGQSACPRPDSHTCQDLHSPPSANSTIGSGIVSPSSRDPTRRGLTAQPPPQPAPDPGFWVLVANLLTERSPHPHTRTRPRAQPREDGHLTKNPPHPETGRDQRQYLATETEAIMYKRYEARGILILTSPLNEEGEGPIACRGHGSQSINAGRAVHPDRGAPADWVSLQVGMYPSRGSLRWAVAARSWHPPYDWATR
jgi:hypothetical protein